ncbi:hypothetical protein [Burkholderia sp. YIM B11467]
MRLIFGVFLCALYGCNDSSDTRAEGYFYPIVLEAASSIDHLPGAVLEDQSIGSKYGSAWSIKNFSINASEGKIDSYYDGELISKGWRLCGVKHSWNFFENREYCKGKINLSLEVRGEKLTGGVLDFDVSVFWSKGAENNCQ